MHTPHDHDHRHHRMVPNLRNPCNDPRKDTPMSWSWWPENSDGQEHEAWIQPIFGDGEEGTGTTNSEGIVFDCYGPNERIRPFSEVTHLRMKCECGWTGQPVAVATLPAAYIDARYNEPTEHGEQMFLDEWHAHLAPLKAADAATCPTCGHRR
jgi:hypothetical protein